MAKKSEFQEKMKIIEKLANLGVKSEKDIEQLKPRDLLAIENISFAEIDLISKIKLCVQENTLFSFLTFGISTPVETKKASKKLPDKSEVKANGE